MCSHKRWTALVWSAVLMVLGSGLAHAQAASDPLPYSKGFLVTGNYVVGGVDLTPQANPPVNGFATGSMTIAGVPADADVVAAFLYWEEIFTPTSGQSPTSGVQFRGTPISPTAIKASSFLLPTNPATCWGAAGSTGARVAEFRADVLYLLPKRFDATNTWTGKYLVNGAYTVSLPELSGNKAVQSAGATLVIVYRDSSDPLRKITFYDGAFAAPDGATITQRLRGFYKSSAVPSAQVTYIVGSGGNNHGDAAFFNGVPVSTSDPFPQTSPSSDRSWANPSYDVSAQMGGDVPDSTFGETATTALAANATPLECRSVAAMVFSTAVADVDHDGLPDGLEDAPNGLSDPPTVASPSGTPLPNLNAMGASSSHQDLFIEMNAMYAPAGTSYGAPGAPYNASTTTLTDPAGHNHMPTPDVLQMIGDVYAAHHIAAHFDVGDVAAYHNLGPAYTCAGGACAVDQYLVPSAYARGGEEIQERACSATDGSSVNCEFPAFPGTVGWKIGLQLYRDAPVADNGSELSVAQINSTWKSGAHRRRFDPNRSDYFHYVLYAHARGKPKSSLPCLDQNGSPTSFGATGTCAAPLSDNPDFHVPLSVSGVADLPGGNVLVTLGLWGSFTGTSFIQASTTFHELGHNLGLWHGGQPAVFGDATHATFIEPNCKPLYLSSMSYLYQVHGLFDDAGALHFDYSSGAENDVDEMSLSDAPASPQPPYIPAWFAPAGSSLAKSLQVAAATRFCNGPSFSSNPALVPPAMARVFAPSTTAAIDWNGDGVIDSAGQLNVNFDGTADGIGIITSPLRGYNDWQNIRLDQIGAGRTEMKFSDGDFLDIGAGDFLDFGSGDFLDIGSGDFLDFGSGDFLDIGAGDFLDFGSGDFLDIGAGDFLDIGAGDFMDIGSGDFLDIGAGDFLDFGSGDFLDIGAGSQSQELDFDKARAMGRAPAYGLQGCVINTAGCLSVPKNDPTAGHVLLHWSAPPFGQPAQYLIFRKDDSSNKPFVQIGTSTTTSFVDLSNTPGGKTFDYFVKVEYGDETPHTFSGKSNTAVVPIPKN